MDLSSVKNLQSLAFYKAIDNRVFFNKLKKVFVKVVTRLGKSALCMPDANL